MMRWAELMQRADTLRQRRGPRRVTLALALALLLAALGACSEAPEVSDDAAGGDDAAVALDAIDAVGVPDAGSADVPPPDAEAEAELPSDASAAATDISEPSADLALADAGPCPVDGLACDDGDPCTADDRCKAGVCVPGASQLCECASDVDCLLDADLCAGKPVCKLGVFPYRCGVAPGTAIVCDPALSGVCQTATCHPATGLCTAIAKPNGTACQDGAPCTLEDACKGGACVAGVDVCQCQSDKDCAGFDDGNACNGALACDKLAFPHVCKVVPASVPSCDAASAGPCQVVACEPKTGACKSGPAADGAACNDGDACTANEACNAGACNGGTLTCACKSGADCAAKEDGDPCNGTLICQQNACVVDAKTIVLCDPKGDTACAKAACSKTTGTCGLAAVPTLTPCSDNDPCTIADSCDAGQCKSGADLCQCKKDADCAAFEDGNACNGMLFCSKSACVLDAKSVVSCNTSGDGPCNKTACQPATGACVQGAISDGFPCSDGQTCTVGDACVGGGCKSGVDVCECKSDGDCVAKEDGDLCNGSLICKQNKCAIDPASLVSCPKPAPCKQVACDAKSGLCVTSDAAEGVGCDDLDPCTPNDACQGGTCKGGPTVCTGPTWAEVYKLAIQGNGCSGCHGGYGSQSQAYQTVINGFHCGGKLVVPGDAAASKLVAKLVQGVPLGCGDKMPDNTPGVSKAAGDALQAWINAGAKP